MWPSIPVPGFPTTKLLIDKATLAVVVIGEYMVPPTGDAIAKLGLVEHVFVAVLEFLGDGVPVAKSVLF
jgi:hypothetical protein